MTTTRSRSVTDAVRRALEIDDLGQQRRVRLTLTTPLDLAPARLWPLLSTPEGLATWFGPVQGDLSEGGRFRAPAAAGSLLAATGTDPVEGSVLAVEAPHRLVMSWERGGPVDPVTFRLGPEDDGPAALVPTHTPDRVRAELEESGPGVWALPWELALLAFAAVTDGWRSTCLARPEAPDAPWLARAAGHETLEGWAVRWAAEGLAAGLDEQQVRRAESAVLAALAPTPDPGQGPPAAGPTRTTLPLSAQRPGR